MLSRLRLFVAGTLLGPSLFSSGVVSVYAHEVANDEQCPKFKFIGKKAEVENDSGPKKEKKERCVSVKAAAIGVAGGGALASAGFYGSRLICDALKEPERKMYVTYVDYLGRNGNIFAIYDSDWGVNLMMFSTAEQREDFVRKHNFIDVCGAERNRECLNLDLGELRPGCRSLKPLSDEEWQSEYGRLFSKPVS